MTEAGEHFLIPCREISTWNHNGKKWERKQNYNPEVYSFLIYFFTFSCTLNFQRQSTGHLNPVLFCLENKHQNVPLSVSKLDIP